MNAKFFGGQPRARHYRCIISSGQGVASTVEGSSIASVQTVQGRQEHGYEATTRTKQSNPEQGQVAVLIIGYMLLSLLVVATVTAISSIYLDSKKLLSLADGASAVAAENVSFTTSGAAPGLQLNQDLVSTAVGNYLREKVVTNHFDQLSISPQTGSPDGRSARVVLTAVVHPPIISFLLPEGIQITAESISRPQLYR